mgnify:CR=1 FL=1
MAERRVPRIRFKGFEEDWEQRKLGEVVNEITRTDENSDAPVMMITASDGFINQSERYSTDNAGQSLRRYILLERGELAYNHGASKLRPYGSCFALTTEEKARVPFVYHCFSTEREEPELLSLVLNGKSVELQLRKIVSSGARMDGLLNISFEEYSSIPINLPIKLEQTKIVDFFRSLDKVISLHQRKLEKLKILKKAMLEKMFPKNGEKVPEIRFSGFADDWEQRKLGELAFITTGKLDANAAKRDGEYNFFTCGKEILKTNSYAFDGEAILINGNGDLGYTRKYVGKFNAYQRTYVLQGFVMDYEYIEHAIHKFLPDKIKYESIGGAMPYIKIDSLMNLELTIPVVQEAVVVTRFLNELDSLLSLHQRKLEKLRQIKKSMLERMFV